MVDGDGYDYVTRTSANQGILRSTGFVNKENLNNAGTWSLGLLQMDFFYRKRKWYAGQFVRKIVPKFELTQEVIQFFTTVLNKQKPILLSVLVRNVDDTFKKLKVQLPIKDGKINYEFMESFIKAIDTEQITRLSVYLKNKGLKDCKLSTEEEQALHEYENIEWGEFRIGDLFKKIKTNKLPYKADQLPKQMQGSFTLPCLTSSFKNQGLNYFAPREEATILKNVITLPSNSDVYRAYFQSREFTVLSDAYAIQWSCDTELLPVQYLFMVTCINKVTDLPIYSYKNKLGGWNTVKDKVINLPVKDGKIDYNTMINLISAIQKNIIKNIVPYVKDKLD